MGSKKLPRMRGRTSALSHMKDRIRETYENIALVESLEYSVYEGIITGPQWVSRAVGFAETSERLLCKVDRINKESVRVTVLAIQHLSTHHRAYHFREYEAKFSITFQEFKAFKLRELKPEDIPIYCNLDIVTKEFRNKYMM